MKKIKVTIAQIKEQEDLTQIKNIILSNKGSDILVFPESTLRCSRLNDVVKPIKEISKKTDTRIIIGIIHKENKKTVNYAYYISPNRIQRYQKVHVHWTEKHVPGKEFKVIDTGLGKIGMLICFDTAFVESGRVLALKGAEIIFVLSAIPHTFSYEIAYLRSQSIALNNQLFVIHLSKPGKEYIGRSAIFGPDGKEYKKPGKYEGIFTKTIDFSILKSWRKKEKIFPNRKPDLYKLIAKK